MEKLKIFNETNGVFPGVNTPQFSQLEYLAEMANQSGCQLPNLGLFGEASTGKTTSVKLLANICNYRILIFNAVSIKTEVDLNKSLVDQFMAFPETGLPLFDGARHLKPQKAIVFFDEAHALKEDIQTALLSALESKGLFTDKAMGSVITENITWIFATTDPSNLLYPLTTRLHSITFDQYSVDDVANIIRLKHANKIDHPSAIILAQCAKLVPRTAIRNTELLITRYGNKPITVVETEKFVKEFLNMETNGIDSIDKRILTYLSSYTKQIAPVDTIALSGFSKIKEMLEAKGVKNLTHQEHKEYNRATFQIIMLTEKMKISEALPKSRQDISTALRLLDLNDLETRLSYLEKLSYVEKTSRGIVLAKKYR